MSIQESLDNLTVSSEEYFSGLQGLLEEVVSALSTMAEHTANGNNPHQTTSKDIGLGKVLNLPLASAVEALDTRFNYAYMTPYLTHLAIDDRISVINKSYVGLSSVENFGMATETQARNGSSNAKYMTPLRTQQNFDENTKHIKGEVGDVLFVSEDNSPMAMEAGRLLERNPALVQGQTEMDQLKGYVESFDNVFNEWLRISHDGTGVYPADPNELNDWSYDAATESISCATNSATLIGFISPERHEDFIFDVILSSTDTDDDWIGVCFGFVSEDGEEHTLTAMRTPGGVQGHEMDGVTHHAKLLDVYYDTFHPTRRTDLGSTNGGLKWGDGVVDDNRTLTSDIGSAHGWGTFPAGCRLRVERFGDVFTIKTSDLGESTLKESATVTVDINDYPELEKFRGPIQFGYVCFSQRNATWEVLRRPVELGTVVDAETLEAWGWDGAQFVAISEEEARSRILPNRLYYTELTGKLYYNEPFRGLVKISG